MDIQGRYPHFLNSQFFGTVKSLLQKSQVGFPPQDFTVMPASQEPVLAADFPSTPQHGAATATARWGVHLMDVPMVAAGLQLVDNIRAYL